MIENKPEYKTELYWRFIYLMVGLHLAAIYGFYIALFYIKLETSIFTVLLFYLSMIGIQCGGHRLWSHRSYKAKLPLQILLASCNTLAFQNSIYHWCRDHRVHHKYSETDADPHNAKRGFFFAHVGWCLCKKHPDCRAQTVNMSDLENNPVVAFQKTYYLHLLVLIWGLLPTYIPVYFWGESLCNAFFVCVMFRYILYLNITWTVNSAAHLWGNRPYDESINPVECSIRHLSMGEGYHNYHHTFPWDYSASEYGSMKLLNLATAFIDLMAWIGLAYDLRKPSQNFIKKIQMKKGDLGYKNNSALYELTTGILSICLVLSPLFLKHI